MKRYILTGTPGSASGPTTIHPWKGGLQPGTLNASVVLNPPLPATAGQWAPLVKIS